VAVLQEQMPMAIARGGTLCHLIGCLCFS
jgi:hypothetical protein